MVENPISALAVILGSLTVLIPVLAGIGLLVRRSFGLRQVSWDDVFLAIGIGYSFTLLFLMAWSLWLPVGRGPLPIVLAAGVTGLAVNAAALRSLHVPRIGIAPLLCGAAAIAWVAAQTLARFRSWDGGLYHVQIIEWAKAYPVVPGLANLHGPLGFNNACLLYDAMLDAAWPGNGFRIANASLILPAILISIVAGVRWIRSTDAPRVNAVYGLAVLPAILHLGWEIPTYSTDVPMAIMLLAAGAQLQRAISGDVSVYRFFALGILLAAAVSIKITAALFAAAALVIAAWLWWSRAAPPRAGFRRAIIATGIAISLFGAVWTARSVILSGYPFYPLTIAGFEVDWQVPVEHAEMEREYIEHTEREFTFRFIGLNWLRVVLLRDVYAATIPGIVAVLALLMIWRRRRRSRVDVQAVRNLPWLVIPPALAIAAWILTAPSTRYATPLFWTLAAMALSALAAQGATPPTRIRRVVHTGAIAVAVSPLFVEPAIAAVLNGSDLTSTVLTANGVTHEFRAGRRLPPPHDPRVVPFTTSSGLVLNVPDKTAPADTGLPNACWKAPLPCTPNPAPNLRLRVPGNLSAGFAVDGDWAMLDWPYYWQSHFLPEWRARNPRPGR